MPTIIEGSQHQSNFVPHPEGTFIATMGDCWLKTRPNPWKNTARKDGTIDTRETITELKLLFFTGETVSVDGKEQEVAAVYSCTASIAENSNLRKFLKGWFPKLTDDSFVRFDADKLIGRGAYITVVHRPKQNGELTAFVSNAAAPPKGAVCPTIPADYVRYDVRQAEKEAKKAAAHPAAAPEKPQQKPVATAEGEDDAPF